MSWIWVCWISLCLWLFSAGLGLKDCFRFYSIFLIQRYYDFTLDWSQREPLKFRQKHPRQKNPIWACSQMEDNKSIRTLSNQVMFCLSCDPNSKLLKIREEDASLLTKSRLQMSKGKRVFKVKCFSSVMWFKFHPLVFSRD